MCIRTGWHWELIKAGLAGDLGDNVPPWAVFWSVKYFRGFQQDYGSEKSLVFLHKRGDSVLFIFLNVWVHVFAIKVQIFGSLGKPVYLFPFLYILASRYWDVLDLKTSPNMEFLEKKTKLTWFLNMVWNRTILNVINLLTTHLQLLIQGSHGVLKSLQFGTFNGRP